MFVRQRRTLTAAAVFAGVGRASKFVTKWALGCTAAIVVAGSAFAQTPVERGSYLVNGILTCGNCHTPRGPGGVWDMSKQLSGGPRTWDEVTFKAKAAKLKKAEWLYCTRW